MVYYILFAGYCEQRVRERWMRARFLVSRRPRPRHPPRQRIQCAAVLLSIYMITVWLRWIV